MQCFRVAGAKICVCLLFLQVFSQRSWTRRNVFQTTLILECRVARISWCLLALAKWSNPTTLHCLYLELCCSELAVRTAPNHYKCSVAPQCKLQLAVNSELAVKTAGPTITNVLLHLSASCSLHCLLARLMHDHNIEYYKSVILCLTA